MLTSSACMECCSYGTYILMQKTALCLFEGSRFAAASCWKLGPSVLLALGLKHANVSYTIIVDS